MPTTTIQPLPYPSPTGVTPDVPRDIKALAEAVEGRVVMRFATAAARDAALPSGKRVAGMGCFIEADQTLYMWSTTGTAQWRVVATSGVPVALTFEAGYAGTAQYQFIGPWVFVWWACTTSIASTGTALPLLTLPTEARPANDTPATLSNTSLYPMTGRITAAGAVQLRNNHSSSIASHQGVAVYPRKTV